MAIGDVKYLKSGSPSLTVVQEDGTMVTVSWFANGVYNSQMFPEGALVDSDPQPAIDKAREAVKAEVQL